MNITDSIKYIGVNDHKTDLFEGQYEIPNGIAYNSYVIIDEKIAVLDTVDTNFTHQWLDNLQKEVGEREINYLIINHMEPDHSANIYNFMKTYPHVKIVSTKKSFSMMKQFFGDDFLDNQIIVGEGDTLSLGKHTLTFYMAPMVHWPEVMVTYDLFDKVLFSADGFGKFGALDIEEDWACEARRYYFGIVGKYGAQVQSLLKKASTLDIQTICPLHGPILKENLSYYINLYNIWSSYQSESDGIMIAYTSVYGNTKKAVELLKEKLIKKGAPKVVLTDLARCDITEAVEDAFRYPKLVLATTTYNADIFPFMKTFIHHLTERNFQNKTLAFIENGSWSPLSIKIMKEMFAKSKNLNILSQSVSIMSAMNSENEEEIEALSDALCAEYLAKMDKTANKNDLNALFNIGYGLYVVTSNDGIKDNGLIVNTVTQLTNTPNKIGVTISKENYSCHVIEKTLKMNINVLSTDTPFSIFENFGFKSGRNTDKFENIETLRSDNSLVFLKKYIN